MGRGTVRQALDAKRAEVASRPAGAAKLAALVLCKHELFYLDAAGRSVFGDGPDATVYPVSRESAVREARRLGVAFSEE